jgi:flagellar hook protein FlgE
MSVTSAMMSGVSGLLSNAEAINVIGNNISNVNTAGFKYGRALFSDILSNNISSTSQVGRGTQIQAIENIFSQGAPLVSENATDISLSGTGFFIVKDSSATPSTYFTRAGAFHLDDKGQYLINPDGMRLCDSAGAPIDIKNLPVTAPALFDKITNIGLDGTISYVDTDGKTSITTVAKGPVVGIATFPSQFGLEKAGGNLYKENLATGGSGAAVLDKPTVNSKIMGRSLEQSNVDIASQMINLIITQRAYSANSKSITTGDEMTQEVIGLKR